MAFQPLRLLILYDGAEGLCQRVVPRMRQLLEHRAFVVDEHTIDQGPVEVTAYAGLVIGSPVLGLGLRGAAPTPALADYVRDELDELDEHKVAVFCVHPVRPGFSLDRMKGMAFSKGAEVVAAHAYSVLRPHHGEHVLPTECMVRIR